MFDFFDYLDVQAVSGVACVGDVLGLDFLIAGIPTSFSPYHLGLINQQGGLTSLREAYYRRFVFPVSSVLNEYVSLQQYRMDI